VTGRELIEALASGAAPPPPIASLMPFDLTEVADGMVRLRAMPGAEHLNPMGTVHGGFAMTVLDAAMAMAIFTRLPEGVGPVSIEIQTRFHRPIFPTTGEVRVEGRVLHLGSLTATAEGDLRNAGGKLLAHATCTCAIVAFSASIHRLAVD
jgi:uncharacterized protein (TIGR00369 family)